jgi:alanine racemase
VSEPRIEVDLDALRHNVRLLSSAMTPARIMLVVKADAYSHGLVPVAKAALVSGADSLAVLDVPTGLTLRAAGISAQLLAWMHGPDTDFAGAVRGSIDLGVSSLWQLDAILAASEALPARIHLKIDTGLHRNGASIDDWPALVSATVAAEKAGRVELVGIWSHLADASPEDDAAALGLLHAAVRIAKDLGANPEILHIAASSAAIRAPEARLDLVRLGIAAYGISPFDDKSGSDLGLIPVMTFHAPIVAVNAGIATIAVGSADGIYIGPRSTLTVAIGGERHPIRSVDIDSLTIDVGESSVAIGDDVIIFGNGTGDPPTAEEWAVRTGTVPDEVVLRASPRIPRTYLGEI